MEVLKTNKDFIFHNDDIPKSNQMSQLYAVALQLLGTGIVKLMVTDKTKVVKDKVVSADITMKVCTKDVQHNE